MVRGQKKSKYDTEGYAVDPRICVSCKYGGDPNVAPCDYILKTGKIRPTENSSFSSCEVYVYDKKRAGMSYSKNAIAKGEAE